MTQKITINEARQKLGKKAEDMSNKQIEAILTTLYSLSSRVVNQIVYKGDHAN